MQYYRSKTVNLHAIERVDTATISDERMKTNQFLGSNMQVANLVVHATAKFGMEFVGVLDQTNILGRRSL